MLENHLNMRFFFRVGFCMGIFGISSAPTISLHIQWLFKGKWIGWSVGWLKNRIYKVEIHTMATNVLLPLRLSIQTKKRRTRISPECLLSTSGQIEIAGRWGANTIGRKSSIYLPWLLDIQIHKHTRNTRNTHIHTIYRKFSLVPIVICYTQFVKMANNNNTKW